MEILRAHLDGDFRVSPLSPSAVTPAHLDAVEAKLGVRYPDAFRAHVCGSFPAMYVEVKEALWPRPKLYDVGPAWSFAYGIHTFTPHPESEDWMRLDHAAEDLRSHTELRGAPILKIEGDADVFCVDERGALCRFDHEQLLLEPIEGDFWSLLDAELRALRERKDRKLAER